MIGRRFVLALALASAVGGCKESPKAELVALPDEPTPARAAPAPSGADDQLQIVLANGERVDPETEASIRETLAQLQNAPSEAPSAADLAAKVDPKRLVGAWQIAHTIYETNGEVGGKEPPLAPTRWVFGADGRMKVAGPMTMDLDYVYTGDKVVLTGFGPKQDYRVEALTDTELRLVARIEAGSTVIENTTVFTRAE